MARNQRKIASRRIESDVGSWKWAWMPRERVPAIRRWLQMQFTRLTTYHLTTSHRASPPLSFPHHHNHIFIIFTMSNNIVALLIIIVVFIAIVIVLLIVGIGRIGKSKERQSRERGGMPSKFPISFFVFRLLKTN
jgi:hypothetical protein